MIEIQHTKPHISWDFSSFDNNFSQLRTETNEFKKCLPFILKFTKWPHIPLNFLRLHCMKFFAISYLWWNPIYWSLFCERISLDYPMLIQFVWVFFIKGSDKGFQEEPIQKRLWSYTIKNTTNSYFKHYKWMSPLMKGTSCVCLSV